MIEKIYLSLVALGCGGMAGYLFWKRLALFLSGRRARGSFVRWELRGLRRMYYHPVVRFEAQDGAAYEFVGMPGSSRQPREKASYPVLYPPERPQEAVVHGFLAYWAAPLMFLLFAGAAVFIVVKKLS